MEYRYTDKCVGCLELKRDVVEVSAMGLKNYRTDGGKLTLYHCLRGYFPYQAVISGLMKPSTGINMAARKCPKIISGHCILCLETKELRHYGHEPLVYICSKHDRAWGSWLDEHPGKRDYIAPKVRSVRANWIEVFREFIEDMRQNASVQ